MFLKMDGLHQQVKFSTVNKKLGTIASLALPPLAWVKKKGSGNARLNCNDPCAVALKSTSYPLRCLASFWVELDHHKFINSRHVGN